MTPIDFRNTTWEAIQGQLHGSRQSVYAALMGSGPRSTRELAALMGADLLAVRPRVTELCQLGLARCVDEVPAKEGHYVAIPIHQAKHNFEMLMKSAALAADPQQELAL